MSGLAIITLNVDFDAAGAYMNSAHALQSCFTTMSDSSKLHAQA